MKGAVLRHIHVVFRRKGPVVSQHAPAQGYAGRVFPACLRRGSAEMSTPKTSTPKMPIPEMSTVPKCPKMSTVPKCLFPKCLLLNQPVINKIHVIF